MSLKYQRIREHDEQLPYLLKQLTRAFSSITLAIILLLLITCYGVIGSVPIGMLATAILLFIAVALPIAVAILGTYRLGRSVWKISWLLIVLAILIAVLGVLAVTRFTQTLDWFSRYHTTVIYRLRYFEMTELEFYSWWPMKLLLGLFVLNMIWATLRRIEFKFANLGVLTVHSGIVILTLGSMIYGHAKYEGDTILWRDDQPLAQPVNTFYDATTPAIYLTLGKEKLMIPLPQLPRYNDYDPQTHALAIKLHKTPGFSERFGKQLKATIPGFLSYANLQTAWINDPLSPANPTWQVQLIAGKNGKPLSQHALVGSDPTRRSLRGNGWAVQYLIAPSAQHLKSLTDLDRSIGQFYLIQPDANKPQLQLLICLPNQKPMRLPLNADRFPLATFEDHSLWLQLLRYLPHARETFTPVPVPRIKRISKEEGTYLNALLPVDLQMPLADGSIWNQRVWLTHMRYPDPDIATDQNRPVEVTIPTLGKVQWVFSRKRYDLPFTMTLNDFAMEPYPGSNMPKDFYSNITLTLPTGQTTRGITRLNNPLIYNRIKISQTGWDPGDPRNPRNPSNQQKDAQGRYKYQQRYVILGIGNNVGIQFIFIGACLIMLGIPWAFYVKPALTQMRKRKIQTQLNQTNPITNKPLLTTDKHR